MNTLNLITGTNKQTNKRINVNSLKSLLYSSLVLVVLLSVVSCGCENPAEPDNNDINPTNINPTNINPTNVGIPIERPLYIVSIPENSITKTVSIDTNILDLYLRKGYDPDEFSVTHVKGVDDGIIDVNALNFDGNEKTLQGTIALKQRLDFENPTDGGENSGDNDYEVAIFRVKSETFSNDFKLIVRITDAPDPKKLEILIDSFHLDDIDQPRGIREIYLYEDSQVMDPLMGDDSNNFLIADLVESRSVRGDVDASTDLSRLYDQDDKVDAFLTATTINSNSNTYHRISLEFTEEINIQKVGIRGRQLGGYYGFIFILRDKENRIIYVHQASNPLTRGSGSEVSATSTYAFVPDYANFQIIDDYRIQMNNMYFDIAENTIDVLLIDNFFVVPGYEYERGFVSIDPGADFDKFNTDDLYFLDNELVGLSLKNPPDAEDHQDADGNGLYELGTVTITNFDRGSLTFALPVRVVNVPTTVSLTTDAIERRVNMFTSNVIENLTTVVHFSNFENSIYLGTVTGDELGTYRYQLTGEDAHHFKIVGNTLKTVGQFGFREVSGMYVDDVPRYPDPFFPGRSSVIYADDVYNFQIQYIPEGVINNGASLDVTIKVYSTWRNISTGIWPIGNVSQLLLLTNGDLLTMSDGGSKKIWLSKDGGLSWNNISVGPWVDRREYQMVVLTNNDILFMGGGFWRYNNLYNDIWRSRDGGVNWINITPTVGHWPPRSKFKAVVLKSNNEVLILGGIEPNSTWASGYSPTTTIWRSADSGESWQSLPPAGGPSIFLDAVVLNNGDILAMGDYYKEERSYIALSKNGGTNWTYASSGEWYGEAAGMRALPISDTATLVLGGYSAYPAWRQDQVWNNTIFSYDPYEPRPGRQYRHAPQYIHYPDANWSGRGLFGASILPHGDIVVLGGRRGGYQLSWGASGLYGLTDGWKLERINPHYR